MELPLSALAIIALLFCNFFLMEPTSLDSGCGCCGGYGLLFCCKVCMRSATILLYASLSPVGNCVMAVSASRARFCNQFFLACMLYLGPFCSKANSGMEKEMSVMLTTLGWKLFTNTTRMTHLED